MEFDFQVSNALLRLQVTFSSKPSRIRTNQARYIADLDQFFYLEPFLSLEAPSFWPLGSFLSAPAASLFLASALLPFAPFLPAIFVLVKDKVFELF